MNEATERLNFLLQKPDMTKPTILEIELFFGVGEILFKFDETIDMTLASVSLWPRICLDFVKGNPGSDFSLYLLKLKSQMKMHSILRSSSPKLIGSKF